MKSIIQFLPEILWVSSGFVIWLQERASNERPAHSKVLLHVLALSALVAGTVAMVGIRSSVRFEMLGFGRGFAIPVVVLCFFACLTVVRHLLLNHNALYRSGGFLAGVLWSMAAAVMALRSQNAGLFLLAFVGLMVGRRWLVSGSSQPEIVAGEAKFSLLTILWLLGLSFAGSVLGSGDADWLSLSTQASQLEVLANYLLWVILLAWVGFAPLQNGFVTLFQIESQEDQGWHATASLVVVSVLAVRFQASSDHSLVLFLHGIAVLSALLAAGMAALQTQVLRLIAYLMVSLASIGFALIFGSPDAADAGLRIIWLALFVSFGLSLLGRRLGLKADSGIQELEGLFDLSKRHAALYIVFLGSAVGFPGLVGLPLKISALMDSTLLGSLVIVLALLLSFALHVVVFVRLTTLILRKEPPQPALWRSEGGMDALELALTRRLDGFLWLCALVAVLLGIRPHLLFNLSQRLAEYF